MTVSRIPHQTLWSGERHYIPHTAAKPSRLDAPNPTWTVLDTRTHCWWFLGTEKWDGFDIFSPVFTCRSCFMLFASSCISLFPFRFIRLSEKSNISEVYFPAEKNRKCIDFFFLFNGLSIGLRRDRRNLKFDCVCLNCIFFFVMMAKSWYAFEQSCDQCFLTPPSSGWCTATYQRVAQSVLMNALYNPVTTCWHTARRVFQKVIVSVGFWVFHIWLLESCSRNVCDLNTQNLSTWLGRYSHFII